MSTQPSPINLAQFDEVFQQQEVVDQNNYDNVPDGKYETTVHKVELALTRAGAPKLAWQLRITGPTHAGRLLFRNNLFASADNLKWLKNDLNKVGLQLEKLSDLENRLSELLDIPLEVTVKTSADGKNQNVFINKRLAATVAQGAPTVESVVPF